MLEFDAGYALLIGIASYPKINKLPKTVLNDARDIHNLLLARDYCGYTENRVKLLLESEASRTKILEEMEWLSKSVNPKSTVLVYFSGHGGQVSENNKTVNYLLPYDCDPSDLSNTAISGTALTDILQRINAERLLVLFDCCYAGGTGELKGGNFSSFYMKPGFDEGYYESLAQGRGRAILASSRSDETSLVLHGMKNSLFTHYLIEALKGKAFSRGDGLIRVFDVFDYVSRTVPQRGNQHPVFKANQLEDNFPIALRFGGQNAPHSSSSHQQLILDRRSLRERLVNSFTLEEVEVICADLEQALADNGIKLRVSLEMVGGTSKIGKIHNLIQYLDRHGYLQYLVAAIHSSRPESE